MDVTLLLTHRCNLACGYCYAGEHHHTDIRPEVLERAIDLLFADGAQSAQLGFFGGEPFLAFDAMRRATELAEREAARRGRTLILQCTTNGSVLRDEHVRFVRDHRMQVTVSIDGIREAHDRNRPCAGGKPSFDQVHRGLRRLLDAGVECDAMMVITPQTAEHAYLSASFLWSEGVRRVRANLALEQTWDEPVRAELREQLVSIGWELLARRLKHEQCTFEPFEREIRARMHGAATSAPRSRVVVSTAGHLYPCAPMVGEDRDDGAEAALRIGHLDEAADGIVARVGREGVRCDRGGRCECAAYHETGDRKTAGPMGLWYAAACRQIGATIGENLSAHEAALVDRQARRSTRRPWLIGLAAIVGAATVPAAGLWWLGGADEEAARPCPLRTGKAESDGALERVVAGDMPPILPVEPIAAPGEMMAPEPPPPPPPPEGEVDGEFHF